MQIIVLTSSFAPRARADQSDNLAQVSMVVEILGQLGFEVSIISATLDLESLGKQLELLEPGLVFNLVEEIQGRGAYIHYPLGLLEEMNIPCTGNGHAAMVMTSSKLISKKIMLAHNVLTPQWLTLKDVQAGKSIKGPSLIKSVWEHGSLGLTKKSVIRNFSQDKVLKQARRLMKEFPGSWFVEKFIPGRELNVSILETDHGPQVLPVAEILFENRSDPFEEIVDYESKWEQESESALTSTRQFLSLHKESRIIRQVEDIALRCWEIFELSGYARVDFRVDSRNIPLVLEVNANPCLSSDAGFMAAALQSGLTSAETINTIIQSGLRNQQLW